MKNCKKVFIIGGGASGMTAAIVAARRGLDVTIFEKEERLGRKILATGNGKCNLGNIESTVNKYNSDFPQSILKRVNIDEIRSFLFDLGVLTKEINGRIFPYSGEASTVQNALRNEVNKLNIIVLHEDVQKITGKYIVNSKHHSDAIVLATGSPATFGFDSTNLLKGYGHETIEMQPALVPLLSSKENIKGLKGVRINARAHLFVDSHEICCVDGEILFRDNGISGSAIFDLSVFLSRVREYNKASVRIDLMPEYSEDEIKEIILKVGLKGLFHKELVSNISRNTGSKGIDYMVKSIKNYQIEDVRLGPFTMAQIANGGLDTKHFDKNTLESKLSQGLFATGEVLNVDGECGGYNLMWAFASGIVVGGLV